MSANMAHTYVLQLLSPAICLGGIRIVGKQLPQCVLQLLHFAWVLSQLWKQSLQEDNKEEHKLTEAAILMLFSKGTYDRALLCQLTNETNRRDSSPCFPGPGRAPLQVWRGKQSAPVSGFALCRSANSWAPQCLLWPSALAPVRPAAG